MYVAEGKGGFRVYDVASIANKGVSEKIITAPVLAARPRHPCRDAGTPPAWRCRPTSRSRRPRNTPEMRATEPGAGVPADLQLRRDHRRRGRLILVNVDTLADGEFRNNKLKRARDLEPGRRAERRAAHHAGGPLRLHRRRHGPGRGRPGRPAAPAARRESVPLTDARASRASSSAICGSPTRDGLEAVRRHQLARSGARCRRATVPLADARRVYVARTYAYVAAKKDGLVIVDVTNPDAAERLPAGRLSAAQLNDAEDVIVGSTNASLFAYVADGRNGLKVIQLTSPDSQPNFYGFSPAPKPELIAWAKTAVSGAGAVARASTATARSTRPAARSRSSAASARARSHARDGAAVPDQQGRAVEGQRRGGHERLGARAGAAAGPH